MDKHVRYLTGTLGKQTRPKVVELRQLTVIQQQRPILRSVTLEIFEGEAVALLGSSLYEKNMLLACLLGQVQPAQGEIRVLNALLPPLLPGVRRQLGAMPQSVDRATGESVALYLQRYATYYSMQVTAAQIETYCARYDLAPDASVAQINELQARVLMLALALIHDPRLVLLVEPLADLTEQEQDVMQGYLQRTQREGRTLLCTFAPPLAEKLSTGYDLVVRLEQGQLRRHAL